MNLIDISSWQRGLDLSTLFAQNPSLDGVIVKSTGGASYVQDTCDPWVQWLIAHGKPWGFYHFLDDDCKHSSGKTEAEWWVKNCRDYFGVGMPFADYEAQAKDHGTKYLKEFLDTVYDLTGVKAGVYCSLSVVQTQNFTAIAEAGYPLWVAQYANYNRVDGFLDRPWQYGSVAPFDRYVMQQYTSMGYLNGYDGRLDFDKFDGTAEDWRQMASGVAPQPVPVLKPADPSVVLSVLHGDYGTGNQRITALTNAGYDAENVQKKVNELYGISLSCKRYIGDNMPYLNSIEWILKCL